MHLHFVALCLFVVGSIAVEDQDDGGAQDDDLWNTFKRKFQKHFSDPTEEDFRRSIWRSRREKMANHNLNAANGLVSFVADENLFTDKTEKEISKLMGTFVPAEVSPITEKVPGGPKTLSVIPASVDWRTSPCMPAIKEQGECGSCWAFTATNLLEFLTCYKTGVRTLLSESQLVNCSTGYGNVGCSGGWYAYAWNYIQTAPGQASNAVLPYYPVDGNCTYNSSSMKAATLLSYAQLPAKNATRIMEALATRGPLATALNATDTFVYYGSGIYSEPSCPNTCRHADVNHAVVLVGYGVSTDGIPYWIVRNSWSTLWGEAGYVRILRGVNMCNIECFVSFARV